LLGDQAVLDGQVASVSTEARLISAGHLGRVSFLMTASSIWV
jgi:hypothetical protein